MCNEKISEELNNNVYHSQKFFQQQHNKNFKKVIKELYKLHGKQY